MVRLIEAIVIGAIASGLLSAAAGAAVDGVVKARNGEDLAAKILLANGDPQIRVIRCIDLIACDYQGTLPTYTGSQPLKIDGKGSIIDATGITDKDVFAATGGGRLKLMRLTFLGGRSGIYVEVPADKINDQKLNLLDVVVRDAVSHGLHIADRANALAGVKLTVNSSLFQGNGLGGDNQDGLHVEESGEGRIVARVLDSHFLGNGSDGLELNETGDGDVSLVLARSAFAENGPNPVDTSDFDDGLDIDEFGPGDVWLIVHRGHFNLNFDDGIDLDENDEGSLYSLIDRVEAADNLDQGVTFEEQGSGHTLVTIKESTLVGNDADAQGIDIRGKGDGDGEGEGDDGGDGENTGTGTLTLRDVIYGKLALLGVTLNSTP